MISWGLLLSIVVTAGALPAIGQMLAAQRVTFLRIYWYCNLVCIPLMYIVSIIQGVWCSYQGMPNWPIWGTASFLDYWPDIGAALFGFVVGNVVAILTWLQMKYGD